MEIPDYSEIIPGLFVGNKHTRDFCGDDVDLVVNCTQKVGVIPDKITIHLVIGDKKSESEKLYKLLKEHSVLEKMKAIIDCGGRVLVHCRVGMSRSCSVIACYLVRYCGMTTDEAIRYIRDKRSIAFENGVNFASAILQVEADTKIDSNGNAWDDTKNNL
jgi:hypothetical protein